MQNENPSLGHLEQRRGIPMKLRWRFRHGIPRSSRTGVSLLTESGLRPPHSTPVALYNNRRKGKLCARARCCHIARTCSVAGHASDSPLCACATASWKSCVSEHPCQAAMKALPI